MVSGFFTSPYDQARIISGEASPILIESKCSTGACCLKSFSKSFICEFPMGCAQSPTGSVAPTPSEQRRCAPEEFEPGSPSILLELHVDAERADLLDEHIEGLRHAGVHLVIAVHDVLVHLGAAVHVVGLDRQHLLQRVGSAVGLQRPDFHLTEALAAELRLAAQR